MKDEEIIDMLGDPNAELMVSMLDSGEEPIEQAMKAIEERFEALGWDQKPMLLIVCDSTDGGEGMVVSKEFLLPPAVLEDPGRGLPILAEELVKLAYRQISADERRGQDPPIEGHFINAVLERFSQDIGTNWAGMAFIHEGWVVTEPADAEKDPEKWAELAAARLTRGLHLHPDRKEMRGVYFADVKGNRRMLTRIRGEEAKVEISKVSGAIPDAIANLIAIGIVLMARKGYQIPDGPFAPREEDGES